MALKALELRLIVMDESGRAGRLGMGREDENAVGYGRIRHGPQCTPYPTMQSEPGRRVVTDDFKSSYRLDAYLCGAFKFNCTRN